MAANARLRKGLEKLAGGRGFELEIPPLSLCSDNAAMIAFAGAERLARGEHSPLDLGARARWPLQRG